MIILDLNTNNNLHWNYFCDFIGFSILCKYVILLSYSRVERMLFFILVIEDHPKVCAS
jgi:hypothetical protein